MFDSIKLLPCAALNCETLKKLYTVYKLMYTIHGMDKSIGRLDHYTNRDPALWFFVVIHFVAELLLFLNTFIFQ